MNYQTVQIITFFLFGVLTFGTHTAESQYRCNGRVYQAPCLEKVPQSSELKNLLITRYASGRAQGEEALRYAKILNASFEPRRGAEGIWRGRVAGNGMIYLHLRIFRGGKFESMRYMGKVPLRNKNTTFAFKSALPKGSQWTWDIIAKAG
jgi:hypothetical protein